MAFYFTDQVVDYMVTQMTPQLAGWGLKAVEKYENNLTPKTPALLVVGLPRNREFSGSHIYTIHFNIIMFVVSQNMMQTKSARQAEMEAIADQIITFWDGDRGLGGNIVQGWVSRDVGGELTIKPSSTVWAGHRIEWTGEQRQVVND